MQQLIITKGLPASGKSTFAKAWVFESPKTRIRVNRDDIRRMLGPYWVPSRESLVTILERKMIMEGLIKDYSVIVDATNFKSEMIIEIGKRCGVDAEIKDFTDVSLEECIKRDSKRGEESVGAEVIRNMYNKYLKK